MEVVGTVGAIITGAQLVFLIGSTFSNRDCTEEKNFDEKWEKKEWKIGKYYLTILIKVIQLKWEQHFYGILMGLFVVI